MDTEIIAIYCLCDDFLKAMHHVDDGQCQMSDAEVMTTAIVAVRYFGGNIEWARAMLQQQAYIPTMLSRSRLNRRLHRVKKYFLTLFAKLAEHWKACNSQSLYVLDTFPVVKKYDERAHGEYRTKRMVLERYDALAAAAARGRPYVSPLGPPRRAEEWSSR